MAPAQSPPIGEGPIAYDSQSDRTIFFYGTDFPSTVATSETWAYDLNTDTWINMEPDVIPPRLLGARMVYDSESDRMILFGGLNPANLTTLYNDTWTYDYDSNLWTKMEPEQRPPGMNFHTMAYDQSTDRTIVVPMAYGGLSDETWVYDYNADTWEVREMTDGPGARDYSAMVYAPNMDRLVLFGTGEPRTTDDTWTYDFDTNTWTELQLDTHPSRRGWHTMVYSNADDLIVLFGGGENRNSFTFETWLYDPNANTWTQVGP
jgi:N-acetylneuraminic acid mutarotase